MGHILTAQPDNWESIGIGGGGATFFPSVSPHDDHIYYITSDMGGIFKSEDAGGQFDILPYYEITSKGAHSKIFFTSNPDILYSFGYTTYPNPYEPLKSLDGGQTWNTLESDPANGEIFHMFVDPHRENRLFVLSYTTAYLSNDGGATFSPAIVGDGTIYIGGIFWDDTSIYVGTNIGLMVSHDDGQTFVNEGLNGDFPSQHKFRSMAGKKTDGQVTLYAVTKPDIWGGYAPTNYWAPESEVVRLEYGNGNSWESMENGFNTAADGGSFHPSYIHTNEAEPNTIYLGGYDAPGMEVYKSIDSGDNWQMIFDAENDNANPNIQTGWIGAGSDYNWWWSGPVVGMEVAQNNANVIIITDYMTSHHSRDGGQTWQSLYTLPSESNNASENTPQHQFYGSNGLEVTSSWWLTWITENDIFASYTDVQGFISHDQGTTWSTGYGYPEKYNTTYKCIKHPDNGKLYSIVCSKHDMYESTYLTDEVIDDGEGELFESSDNGETWTSTYDFQRTVVDIAVDPNHSERFYVAIANSQDGGIYYSNDFGNSFNLLTAPPRTEGHPKEIEILNDGTLVAVYSARNTNAGFTQSSGVFISSDNGQTWEDRSDDEMLYWVRDVEISPSNDDIWYAAVFSHWGPGNTEQGGLFRTTDRGQTWENIHDFYRVRSMTIHPTNPDIAYVCTADNHDGLQYTENLTDENPTFTRLDEYHFANPQRVFFNPYDENEIWVTSFGNGIKKGRVEDNSTSNTHIIERQVMVSPNPSDQHFNIEWPSQYSIQSYTVLSIDGKIIEQGPCPNTTLSIRLDDQGIYFLRLENEQGISIHKLIRL